MTTPAIHTLASYGGRVAMIAQSLASLDAIYGPQGRASLETGAGVKLYIAPRDATTVAELSTAVGQTTAEAITQSFGASRGLFGPSSTSARLEARPLLSETAARTLDPETVLLLPASQHPVKAHRIKFYEDPTFTPPKGEADLPLPYPPRPAMELEKPAVPLAEVDGERPARRKRRVASSPPAGPSLPFEEKNAALPPDNAGRLSAAIRSADQAIKLHSWDLGRPQ